MPNIVRHPWILALLFAASSSSADTTPECIAISAEQVSSSSSLPAAHVRVRNGCDTSFLVIYLECVWLTDESSKGEGRGEVMDLAPGEAGEARIINWSRPDGYDTVQCEIDSVVANSN